MCPWAAARPRHWAGVLVAPRVFRAPSGPAAREIATREPDGSEVSISKPALALPPPTGTAARPSGPSGALHTGGVGRVDVLLGPSNFARNSPGDISNHELVSLVLQRFGTFLKNYRGKLCATFG